MNGCKDTKTGVALPEDYERESIKTGEAGNQERKYRKWLAAILIVNDLSVIVMLSIAIKSITLEMSYNKYKQVRQQV